MANQARQLIIKKIEAKKRDLLIANSWVSLTGESREHYKKLCELQRRAIQGKITEKDFQYVMD